MDLNLVSQKENSVGKRDRSGYSTLLFDFDGTLMDTVPSIIESYQHTYRTLTGEPGDVSRILSTIGEPLERGFDAFEPTLRKTAMEVYLKHNREKLDTSVGVFLGIIPALIALKAKNVNLGIVTSKRLESAKRTLDYFEMGSYFDVLITKESTVRHKPAPDPIIKAMEELKAKNPRNTLYIGDSIHDLLCARNAEVDIAIVEWTYMDKAVLKAENPTYWIRRAQDLVDLAADNKTTGDENPEKRV